MLELTSVFIAGVIFYVAPIAGIIWCIVTMNRLRKGQEAIQNRLEAIEQTLNKGSER